jgi:DNA-binding transcriptional ArsR family regulator
MAGILSQSSSYHRQFDGFPVPMDPPPSTDSASPGHVTRELVRWFKLLADETRLRILVFLAERQELNVRALCDLLQLSQPAVSHHLALLRSDGLIECRRDGKHNFYRILPDRFRELTSLIGLILPSTDRTASGGTTGYRHGPG